MDAEKIRDAMLARAKGASRFLVALAGPPAAGKSTLAERLLVLLPEGQAAVVPMDGFHYDDLVLAQKGLSHRKGAPETFDFRGFEVLLERLRSGKDDVAIPLFDRGMELSRAAAAIVGRAHRTVVVEGNYLLLDEEPWRRLKPLFDMTVFVDVPQHELERRLVERWRFHGREEEAARRWIDTNDMPNIRRVLSRPLPADLVVGMPPEK
ncbi:MAG TPA: nucleoside triphosphate hydrolase [Mesorhizobium sp.]|jgi:pantothenate kinase|nr:nucleoside triphosphate hydrolase [Mesorhizobium sp.]